MRHLILPNRNGTFITLERAGPQTFRLSCNDEYIRIIYDRNGIIAVDPPGGPFISTGGRVAGMEVESIRKVEDGVLIGIKENEALRVLFLDFDGVLTSDAHTRKCIFEYRQENMYGIDWFDPACIASLRKIIDNTNAVIVISSSWRELGEEKLHRLWDELQMPGELFGTTPEWVLTKREAIGQWLKEYEYDRYVIIDDATLDLPFSFKTNPAVGLTDKDADEIIKLLNNRN